MHTFPRTWLDAALRHRARWARTVLLSVIAAAVTLGLLAPAAAFATPGDDSGDDPEGRISLGLRTDGLFTLSGHAFDRSDLGAPIILAVFQDRELTHSFAADAPAPELRPYGVAGKGIDAAFLPSTRQAPVQVCVAGINIGAGENSWLGCSMLDARGTSSVPGSTTDPASEYVLVNKQNPLSPVDHVPGDLVDLATLGVPSANGHSLREPAANAMRDMFEAARASGITLDATSGYRSYATQQSLHEDFVSTLGQSGADLTSARPGYSEHQTGLAVDLSSDEGCVLEQCWASTLGGQWVAANAHTFGFIERYPEGMTSVTGFEWEPWHYRYVGVEVATAMHDAGVTTYEQWLGVPAAPGY
ncbi:hypothetical protein GCM10011490_16480 [Pseudoclavibacter endophyticus]|uniref:M15 family metallopeptidase n=1 Tax=Pseudoclavibacter endophyticus TaxID=1778590 RepID=A0A6H9WMF3_9MICO|nr:M15 family metallopeptidase [Pseudoclavibacter endophyticus]KAB1648981.1 M15 family metallopeptidase [Pseudoclavibacter endophyticus]GGA66538.1 hypothetical protein GCM10011490_16480 [Pseudoclavibacter endophyticus]